MSRYNLIDEDDLQEWLAIHEIWKRDDNKITSEFVFDHFVQAFGFMTAVAILAEKHNHHPVIENHYNIVKLSMNTHDARNKITNRDLTLAEAIEKIK